MASLGDALSFGWKVKAWLQEVFIVGERDSLGHKPELSFRTALRVLFLIVSFWKSSGFCAVVMLLCSSSGSYTIIVPLCGYHAVEAAQGKVS